jgi:hypothetical protein
MNRKFRIGLVATFSLAVLLSASTRLPADTGTCGGVSTTLPFTDVAGNAFFCQIAEAFLSGLTNGTTPTTYSPSNNVTREQMAAFITRTQDSALRRANRRAALNQWGMPMGGTSVLMTGRITVGLGPQGVRSDGTDLWVADVRSGDVKRVRASDGSVLGTWTGATLAVAPLVANGRVYVIGGSSPGYLYQIDPSQPPGAVTTLSSTLGGNPIDITTDGQFIWTANQDGSISRVYPDNGATTTFYAGFSVGGPFGILFDGTSLWVTDYSAGQLRKVASSGAVVQSVTVGNLPELPVFDGSNIWVPNRQSVSVVRARDGMVLATLTGNGLNNPLQAAFDGQRVLVTNPPDSVSMWNATDLTPLGSFPTGNGTRPSGVCSDGINFWITLFDANQLARF